MGRLHGLSDGVEEVPADRVGVGATDQATVIDDEPNPAALSKPELVRLVQERRNARTTDVIRELHSQVAGGRRVSARGRAS